MWIFIAAGGVAGSLARYYLQGLVQGRSAGAFPTGTLVVNILGSFALGFIARYAVGSTVVSPEVRAGLTIGFCGAFTTMSTFGYESYTLIGDGQFARAATYIAATVLGSIAAVAFGAATAHRLL
jgi:CrcB protein